MASLVFISLYLIVCCLVFGLTESLSNTHYEWLKKFGFWGYAIFPIAMLAWGTLVVSEAPVLMPAGLGIYYVGIFAMFEDKNNRHVGVIHFLGAAFAIIYLLYIIIVWCWLVAVAFTVLSLFALLSKYRIYIIKVMAIITLYLYLFLN